MDVKNTASVVRSDAREAAERGRTATDKYGNSLVKFDPEAERKLRSKIDLYTIPTVAVLYLFCFIDRANVGNARLAGLEKDLKLKGYDYNAVLSVFYISYILCEIPSLVLCKWIGPGWFIPGITLAFGICSIGTAFVQNIAAISGVRFLLGIFEAGMFPGIAYYMSRWYRRSELAFRLSLYVVMAPLAGCFGGLLASGILKLPHFGGLREWRMIFAIEGIITIGLALIGFLTLTDRPESASWLTEEEKALAIARLKSERVATTEVLDRIDGSKMMRGLLSPVTLATSFVFLLNNITVQSLAFFLPTIIRAIYPKYSVVHQQLQTVPPYVVGAFFTVFIPLMSWRFDRRNIFMITALPVVMIGYIMFLAFKDARIRYGATFLITSGSFCFGALANAQVSANVVSDTARSAAIGMTVMTGNLGGLVSTWAFLPNDGPDYPIGNGLNLAVNGLAFILALLLEAWVKIDNERRDKKDVDTELADLDLADIQSLDWKHPGFRWKL